MISIQTGPESSRSTVLIAVLILLTLGIASSEGKTLLWIVSANACKLDGV